MYWKLGGYYFLLPDLFTYCKVYMMNYYDRSSKQLQYNKAKVSTILLRPNEFPSLILHICCYSCKTTQCQVNTRPLKCQGGTACSCLHRFLPASQQQAGVKTQVSKHVLKNTTLKTYCCTSISKHQLVQQHNSSQQSAIKEVRNYWSADGAGVEEPKQRRCWDLKAHVAPDGEWSRSESAAVWRWSPRDPLTGDNHACLHFSAYMYTWKKHTGRPHVERRFAPCCLLLQSPLELW
jgi:hypothetical protein